MAKITIFEGARRLEDTHPFALLACLVHANQTVEPTLEFDEDLLPLAADWLDTDLLGTPRSERPAPPPTPSGRPELPEKVAVLSRVIRRLKNNGYLGGRHTAENNFQRGVPGHLLGFAKEARDRLLKLAILESKNTHGGNHIWLNERRLREIDDIIEGRIEDPVLRGLCE